MPPTQPLRDDLNFADEYTCFATARIIGAAVPTIVGLVRIEDLGMFVAVGTPAAGHWHPATWKEGQPTQGKTGLYNGPAFSAREARATADELDHLVGLAESGQAAPAPTPASRAVARIQQMLDYNRAKADDRIAVGDAEDFPLTVGQLQAILRAQTGNAPSHRRSVWAKTMDRSGGDAGVLWLDLHTLADATAGVSVLATEGPHEDPDSDYWQPYASHLTLDNARELAATLREFADAAPRIARRFR